MTLHNQTANQSYKFPRPTALLERAHLYLRAQHNQCAFYFPLEALGAPGNWQDYHDALCILEKALRSINAEPIRKLQIGYAYGLYRFIYEGQCWQCRKPAKINKVGHCEPCQDELDKKAGVPPRLATPPWPDFSIDKIACKRALDELGENSSLSAVMARAQEIKAELIREEQNWKRLAMMRSVDWLDAANFTLAAFIGWLLFQLVYALAPLAAPLPHERVSPLAGLAFRCHSYSRSKSLRGIRRKGNKVMKLQILRHAERTIGIALIFSNHVHLIGAPEVPTPPQFQRVCDVCTANEAMVFCRDHGKYLCNFCLALHNNSPVCCSYLSMTAAREMLLQRTKHEAHT